MTAYKKKLELLSPAGDMEKLKMAVLYGADAVYLAGTSYGLRGGPSNFSTEEMEEGVRFAHAHGVKVHVTVNIMPRNEDANGLPAYLTFLNSIHVDALIIADLGTFMLAKKYAPDCERHMSTQVSIANFASATAWYELGAKRVVLARELSLEEVIYIRQHTPKDLEIECFAHGAMCVSYSGRCLLSNYLADRDGNGGACAQPCRDSYVLMTERYPGQYIPVREDEKGAYLLNSNDMCMIDHVKELMDAGIDSIKVEGRNKSAYYAAIITGAYRHVIDDIQGGREIDPVWRNEVDHVAHRQYSTGFYYGFPGQSSETKRFIREWTINAVVESCDENGLASLTLKNKLSLGDEVELVGPDTRPFTIKVDSLMDIDQNPLDSAKTPQMRFLMKLPHPVPALSIIRKSSITR